MTCFERKELRGPLNRTHGAGTAFQRMTSIVSAKSCPGNFHICEQKGFQGGKWSLFLHLRCAMGNMLFRRSLPILVMSNKQIAHPSYSINIAKSTGPPSPLLAALLVACGGALVVVAFCKFSPPISHQSTPPVLIG